MKSLILFIIVLDFLPLTYCKKPMGGTGDVYYLIFSGRPHKQDSIRHPDQPIPEEFDARKQWPACKTIGQIQNQGECNVGFIFAYTAAFADRLCIQTKGEWQLPLSAEDLINCCDSCWVSGNSTCEGAGSEVRLIEHLALRGVVTGGDFNSGTGCLPVSEETLSGRLPSQNCTLSCTNPSYTRAYLSDKLRLNDLLISSPANNIQELQIELMKNGPLLASLYVSEDLRQKFSNTSFTGVYTGRSTDGVYEVVRVVGWGVEGEVPYWLIANTYNTPRFFKIQRGNNMMMMEYYMFALFPNPVRREQDSSGCEVLKVVSHLCFVLVTFGLFITK